MVYFLKKFYGAREITSGILLVIPRTHLKYIYIYIYIHNYINKKLDEDILIIFSRS